MGDEAVVPLMRRLGWAEGPASFFMSDWVKPTCRLTSTHGLEASALCRLRQLVEVQSDESHAEAGEEDDQVLTGDGHKSPKAHSLRNVTKYSYCDQNRGVTMSIDARCQEQQSAADRMFMDFKYTRPGSKEQVQALATLSFLIGMWADFLTAEEKRMDQVIVLEAGNS